MGLRKQINEARAALAVQKAKSRKHETGLKQFAFKYKNKYLVLSSVEIRNAIKLKKISKGVKAGDIKRKAFFKTT